MEYKPNYIISRLQWCRFQQQLPSITSDERAGWRAEEAGLIDALGNRERTVFMRKEYPSQFTRYQCGLEDGKALLRLNPPTSAGSTRMEGLRPATLTTSTWVDRRSSQAPPPVHMESRR